MKKITYLFFLFFISHIYQAQTIPFDYSVKLKAVSIDNLIGLHSYAFAQHNGKWLVIGGRKDGIHARQPFAAFPASNNNTDIYVIDMSTQQFWTSSVNTLSTSLKEQLQSTNMNFFQDGDSLYIVGGYGYSATAVDHITYPYLTSVSVSGLINAIIAGNSINSYFKQISDVNFAINGGHLGKIGTTFYLVGGHRFDGRYNPMGNPTYTQTYSDGIRKFNILNAGSQLSYSNYTVITDQVHLHRRDYNLVPQIFPNGEEGYTISSGVFQTNVNLPFLYPVDIKTSGYTAVTGFNQYLSNYHSGNLGIYDSLNNVMHSLFFGGISQYAFVNNVLTQDVNVPFVKTISRVSRDANGNLQETAFTNEMPALIGASAEFIPNHQLPHYKNEVIKQSQLSGDSVMAGHLLGGIYSPQTNPFTANNTSVTNAHATIYEVWLVKSNLTAINPVNGSNPLKLSLFPNPTKKQLTLRISLPYRGNLSILITDLNGKLIQDLDLRDLSSGEQLLELTEKIDLAEGIYNFNFVFDGKFSKIEKVLIKS